ncbi:alcohol dehydrogenase catalytic domain-containing protein [Nocardiopsis suaedae]|uniref:Alcohol dehydrogenase catalytic domain-containing protein n=1 Tax=Nocardiopsis suaedae TaxID=3018444 RepID=A0ABT4TNU5_9ACTN|nr:alcohol dehydrogenase catalytic domain-containing protein [Nocardiopsis suaedae]MDA2806349.1 alcohol dehydrogenase catalytic domain-containing protein [Nocardiopsis suaedae]
MLMRAAVLTAFDAPLEVRGVEAGDPGPGEARVRIAASGVCGSDLKAIDGHSPVVPRLPVVCGHESAGTVDAVGPGAEAVAPGDPVLIAMNRPCGRCRMCAGAQAHLCTDDARLKAVMGLMPDGGTRLRMDGAEVRPYLGIGSFAEYTVVSERALVPLPRDVPLAPMALLSCAVVTGVGAVLTTARVEPGSSVLVVGCGGVGLNAVQGAAVAGAARIVAADLVEAKAQAAGRFGATDTVTAGDGLEERVRDLVPGGVDYAIEATGAPAALAGAFAATRPGGTTVMVGSPPPGAEAAVPAGTLFASRRLMGCQGGDASPHTDLPRLVDLYRAGRLRLEELITERVDLEDVNGAVERVRKGETARALVVPQG